MSDDTETLAEVLAAALADHRAGGYYVARDGHQECYCGHILTPDESYEAHVAPHLAARIAQARAGEGAETVTERLAREFSENAKRRRAERERLGQPAQPACATYPNLGCVCRGALQPPNKGTCTRKRTGDLAPIQARAGEGALRERIEALADEIESMPSTNFDFIRRERTDIANRLRALTDTAGDDDEVDAEARCKCGHSAWIDHGGVMAPPAGCDECFCTLNEEQAAAGVNPTYASHRAALTDTAGDPT